MTVFSNSQLWTASRLHNVSCIHRSALQDKVFRKNFWLGDYGGESPKCITVWSNSKEILWNIYQPPKGARRVEESKVGKKYWSDMAGRYKFDGDARLKLTQEYPTYYGQCWVCPLFDAVVAVEVQTPGLWLC